MAIQNSQILYRASHPWKYKWKRFRKSESENGVVSHQFGLSSGFHSIANKISLTMYLYPCTLNQYVCTEKIKLKTKTTKLLVALSVPRNCSIVQCVFAWFTTLESSAVMNFHSKAEKHQETYHKREKESILHTLTHFSFHPRGNLSTRAVLLLTKSSQVQTTDRHNAAMYKPIMTSKRWKLQPSDTKSWLKSLEYPFNFFLENHASQFCRFLH